MATDPHDDLRTTRAGRDLSFFDLVSVEQITRSDFDLIIDVARAFRSHRTAKFDFNKGFSMMHAFFEASTRTMSSFDLAAKQLSMDTAGLSATSSTTKGESYLDTAQVLDSYNLKAISVRSKESGVPEMLARHVNASVINAGDGWHEHPTQGLLDALTVLDHFGTKDLSGKVYLAVGDIMHSRVFGSVMRMMRFLRAEMRVAAPQTFIPAHLENFGIKLYHKVEEALAGADIVYALRVQEERGSKGYIPTLREYSKMYGISKVRLDMANKNAMLMHAGPVIRDIDVHSALATVDERSHILRQVENGMAVRKALLWLLCNRLDGRKKEMVRL